MQSRNVGYIPEIDHLRFLAALLVFGFHFFHLYLGNWQPFPAIPYLGLITDGYTGVSLFFVLSGFIFMRIALGGEDIRYGRFLRNRLLRIAPLFLVVYVLAISIGRDRFQPTDLLYVLVTNLGVAPTSWHFVTGPAWSISVEFWFYLVFPFLAAFTARHGHAYLLRLVAILLVAKIAAYLASDNTTQMLYSTVIGRMDQFLIGMLAAIVYFARTDAIRRWSAGLLAGSVVLVVVGIGAEAHWFSMFNGNKQPQWIVWGTVEATLWACLIVSYVAAAPRWPRLLERVLRRGGEASFSFYMWHAMILFIAHETVGAVGGQRLLALTLNALVLLVVTYLFARLSYVTIEQPFLAMRKRYVTAEPGDEGPGRAEANAASELAPRP